MIRELQIIHTLDCDPVKARNYFEDFTKFSSFHPLFAGIEKTSEGKYIIKERMVGAPFIKFRYKAEISSIKDEVIYKAFPFMMTLQLNFRFEPGKTPSECLVQEHVIITGPGIIGGILGNIVGKMHPKLIANLNASLKNG